MYEERYESLTKETPIRIAETLVNKRIFSLARPLWYRHLSISDSQLDLRLAGLHMHDGRRTVLRHLRVSLANAHFNLFKSVLLRLPLLTHLTLQVPEDLAPEALSEVAAGIARLDGLKHLTLESPDQCENLTQMWKEFHRIKPGDASHSPKQASCTTNLFDRAWPILGACATTIPGHSFSLFPVGNYCSRSNYEAQAPIWNGMTES